MRYVKGLDTIRAMAVMLVFTWHYTTKHTLTSFAGKLEQLFLPTGVFAVTVFFVLSGYLITNILLSARDENSSGGEVVKNFIIRRALRIFPIYYLTLFVLIIAHCNFGPGELPFIFTYTYNLYSFFTGQWGQSYYAHTWTLSIEEQFYLVWPWLMVFAPKKYLKYIFLFVIGIGLLSSIITYRIYHVFFNTYENLITTSWLCTFAVGGLYAYLSREKKWKVYFQRRMPVLFVLMLIPSYCWKIGPILQLLPIAPYAKILVDSCLSICLIHFVLNNRSAWLRRNFLENRVLNFIGRISYGIYLYHIALTPVFRYLQFHLYVQYRSRYIYEGYTALLPKFAITVGVAYLSYLLIEKPILNWKKRFV